MTETLLSRLKRELDACLPGGIYHRLQITWAYTSCQIDGNRLTEDQVRSIFETRTLTSSDVVRIDDTVEVLGDFRAFDLVIQSAEQPLSHELFKTLHRLLREYSSAADRSWYAVGDYKTLPNLIGSQPTTAPEDVDEEITRLISTYERSSTPTLNDLLEFHVRFERIHPFQDGNGLVGRLILIKECLRHSVIPPIFTSDLRSPYLEGMSQWDEDRNILLEAAQAGQMTSAMYLDRLRVPYQRDQLDPG